MLLINEIKYAILGDSGVDDDDDDNYEIYNLNDVVKIIFPSLFY
jgi:hypothetical protein